MRFHYMGKYNGDPKSLPSREPVPGAVPFREPKDSKTLGIVASAIALPLMIGAAILYFVRCRETWNGWGFILYFLSFVPHEFLHALCFQEDVYMYQNLKQGMLFVIGPEDMSKGRFIFMSHFHVTAPEHRFRVHSICAVSDLSGTQTSGNFRNAFYCKRSRGLSERI